MYCHPPRPNAIRKVQPARLVDYVVAKPWAIIDLERRRAAAPYSIHFDNPVLIKAYAEDKNVALLSDSEGYSYAMATVLVSHGFDYSISLVDRNEWIEYWKAIDDGYV